MKRTFAAGIAAVLIMGGAAAPATAQDPVPMQDPLPSVTATFGSKVSVAGVQGLRGGPTRLSLSLSGRSTYRFGILYALRPGNNTATLRTALRSKRRSAFFSRVLRLEGSVEVLRRQTRSFSVYLLPGTTYAVVDATGQSMRRWRLTTFRTAPATSTAAFPTPAATFLMTDDAFRGPRVLTRNAVVLFQNNGRRLHSASAYRLKPSVRNARVAGLLRAGRFESFKRQTVGREIDVAGLVSSGTEVYAEPPLRAAGRYVLVSTQTTRGRPQYRRGMFSFFTVR